MATSQTGRSWAKVDGHEPNWMVIWRWAFGPRTKSALVLMTMLLLNRPLPKLTGHFGSLPSNLDRTSFLTFPIIIPSSPTFTGIHKPLESLTSSIDDSLTLKIFTGNIVRASPIIRLYALVGWRHRLVTGPLVACESRNLLEGSQQKAVDFQNSSNCNFLQLKHKILEYFRH